MYAAGKLVRYISRGVSTVSSPFQPYGGAVDIIVVEQPDGTFKSCPWYVRFGKSQGVLKAAETIVSVNVNDVDADFHMYLDTNGDAYFLREVDKEDGEWEAYPCCSGDEKNLSSGIRRIQKSKSCDYDADRVDLVSELELSDGTMVGQSASRHGRLFGLSFARRSIKEGDCQDVEDAIRANEATSLEHAEIAADLLEVRWTTNLGTGKKCNGNPPQVPKPKLPVPGVVEKVGIEDVPSKENSLINECDKHKLGSSLSNEVSGASCAPGCEQSSTNNKLNAENPRTVNPGDSVEINTMEKTHVGVDLTSNGSEISYGPDNGTTYQDRNAQCNLVGVECSGQSKGGGRLMDSVGGTKNLGFSTSFSINECSGNSIRGVPVSAECLTEPKDQLSLKRISSEPVCAVLVGKMDTKDYQIPCAGDLPRLGVITKEDNIEHISSCNGDDKKWGNLTESENSEEEQISASDLDDREIKMVDQVGVLLSDDRKDYVPADSSKNCERVIESTIFGEPHQATDKLMQDNQVIISSSPKLKPEGVSSQISIQKHCNDAGEEFITPMAESLPSKSVLLTGNQLGVGQSSGRSSDSDFEAMKVVNNGAKEYPETIAEQGVPFMLNSSQITEEIKSIVSDPAIEVSLCRNLLNEGMGYEAAALAFDAEKLDKYKFVYGCPDIVKDDNLVVRIGGLYFPWEAALPIASAIGSQGRGQVLEAKGMIAVGQADKTSEGTPPNNNLDPKNGSWRLWPFSIKRTGSVKDTSLTEEPASGNPRGKEKNAGKDGSTEKDESTGKDGSKATEGNSENDGSTEQDGNIEMGISMNQKRITEKGMITEVSESKVTKKKIRAKIPASEQLVSLNLKKGKNVVTFSFTTDMQGKQQVDARIFLWKWDTRVVISDVDGTITKSDVLGHVMPMMGMDWSHTGVTQLFSAIKENGYQLLFLSARSILQASTTRQFLSSLKQDGNALPEGPIVISPDGLFPSLYREVIRRAPHEFKISCLEDIKALFPRDHNPFYAGFGNRGTDELSYLKVGIPSGKIFTINPKGEVVVNRRVDAKSYTSLHALVHDMFPETRVIEPEDYNQWNFWRLPTPDIAI